jgi:hypothetical protein
LGNDGVKSVAGMFNIVAEKGNAINFDQFPSGNAKIYGLPHPSQIPIKITAFRMSDDDPNCFFSSKKEKVEFTIGNNGRAQFSHGKNKPLPGGFYNAKNAAGVCSTIAVFGGNVYEVPRDDRGVIKQNSNINGNTIELIPLANGSNDSLFYNRQNFNGSIKWNVTDPIGKEIFKGPMNPPQSNLPTSVNQNPSTQSAVSPSSRFSPPPTDPHSSPNVQPLTNLQSLPISRYSNANWNSFPLPKNNIHNFAPVQQLQKVATFTAFAMSNDDPNSVYIPQGRKEASMMTFRIYPNGTAKFVRAQKNATSSSTEVTVNNGFYNITDESTGMHSTIAIFEGKVYNVSRDQNTNLHRSGDGALILLSLDGKSEAHYYPNGEHKWKIKFGDKFFPFIPDKQQNQSKATSSASHFNPHTNESSSAENPNVKLSLFPRNSKRYRSLRASNLTHKVTAWRMGNNDPNCRRDNSEIKFAIDANFRIITNGNSPVFDGFYNIANDDNTCATICVINGYAHNVKYDHASGSIISDIDHGEVRVFISDIFGDELSIAISQDGDQYTLYENGNVLHWGNMTGRPSQLRNEKRKYTNIKFDKFPNNTKSYQPLEAGMTCDNIDFLSVNHNNLNEIFGKSKACTMNIDSSGYAYMPNNYATGIKDGIYNIVRNGICATIAVYDSVAYNVPRNAETGGIDGIDKATNCGKIQIESLYDGSISYLYVKSFGRPFLEKYPNIFQEKPKPDSFFAPDFGTSQFINPNPPPQDQSQYNPQQFFQNPPPQFNPNPPPSSQQFNQNPPPPSSQQFFQNTPPNQQQLDQYPTQFNQNPPTSYPSQYANEPRQ